MTVDAGAAAACMSPDTYYVVYIYYYAGVCYIYIGIRAYLLYAIVYLHDSKRRPSRLVTGLVPFVAAPDAPQTSERGTSDGLSQC